MPRTLQLAPTVAARQSAPGCCDPGIAPRLSAHDAERFVSDLEILAHPIRIRLLDMLAQNAGTVCVCDLEAAVPVKQPTVSHHLKLLRDAGLIGSEKRGAWVHYTVNRPALHALRTRIAKQLTALG